MRFSKNILLNILAISVLILPSLSLFANIGLMLPSIKLFITALVYFGWLIVFWMNFIKDILSKNIEGILLRSVLLGFLCIVLLNFQIVGRVADGRAMTAISYNVPIILKYFMYYEMSRYIVKERFSRWLICLFLIYILPIIFLLDESFLFLDYSRLSTGSSRAWTLGYGDGLMLLYFLSRKQVSSIMLAALDFVVILVLFYVGSRTNMFMIMLFCSYDYLRNLRYITVVLIVLAGLFISSSDTWDSIQLDRFIVLLDDRQKDASYRERIHFKNEGINDIISNPLLGNFAGQLEVKGLTRQLSPRWGGYMHNILSYVRQFGLLGIVAILLTLLVILNWREMQSYKSLLFYLLLVSVFSRSYVFPYLWIVFGIWEGKRRIYQ